MIKQKAKDHSVYVKHISHNHLIKAQHAPRPMSDWKKGRHFYGRRFNSGHNLLRPVL